MKRATLPIALLVLLAPLGSAADAPTMIVRDARGQIVGTVLTQTIDQAVREGLTDRVPLWVARRVRGAWIFIAVGKNAIWETKDLTSFLYVNDTCRGTPLLETARTRDEVRSTVVFDTQVYWPPGPGAERVIRSRGTLTKDPARCDGVMVNSQLCCTSHAADETRFAAEAVSVALAAFDFHPPFRLEAVPAPPGK
jgi:hypothetical protein